jgi:polyphenol oxidase
VISLDASIALCIRTADCVPLLMRDEDLPVIAAVHAGWRGLAKGIVSKTIELMRAEGAQHIHVSMGPSIGACCYSVGTDVIEALGAGSDRALDGRFYVDLHRICALQAQDAGVASDMIHRVQACTCCNSDSFFSYRREGEHTGRNISLIGGLSCSLPGLPAL